MAAAATSARSPRRPRPAGCEPARKAAGGARRTGSGQDRAGDPAHAGAARPPTQGERRPRAGAVVRGVLGSRVRTPRHLGGTPTNRRLPGIGQHRRPRPQHRHPARQQRPGHAGARRPGRDRARPARCRHRRARPRRRRGKLVRGDVSQHRIRNRDHARRPRAGHGRGHRNRTRGRLRCHRLPLHGHTAERHPLGSGVLPLAHRSPRPSCEGCVDSVDGLAGTQRISAPRYESRGTLLAAGRTPLADVRRRSPGLVRYP